METTEVGERWPGISAVGEVVTLVDVEVFSATKLVVHHDQTVNIEPGERPAAYAVLHRRIADIIRKDGIARVVIKGSSGSPKPAKLSLLESAEVRGVAAAAAASTCSRVAFWNEASASRTYGDRKVDEYVKDDAFWTNSALSKPVRKGSRETAFMLLASTERALAEE